MSELSTRRCDAPKCNHIKGEGNKWWVIFTGPHGALVTTEERVKRLTVGYDLDQWQVSDACAEECLQKILGEWTRKAHAGA